MTFQAKKLNRFRSRYALLFLGSLLLVQAAGINIGPYDVNISGFLLFLAGAFFLVFYFTIVVAISVYMQYWRRILSVLVAPVLTFSLLQAELHTGFTPDYARFLLGRTGYLDQIRPAKGSSISFYAWLWDQTWGVGISQARTVLIYDETDQMLRPPEGRSADWDDRVARFSSSEYIDLRSIADPTPYSQRSQLPSIRRLANHFYLVTEAN